MTWRSTFSKPHRICRCLSKRSLDSTRLYGPFSHSKSASITTNCQRKTQSLKQKERHSSMSACHWSFLPTKFFDLCPSIYLSIYLSIYRSIDLARYLSICLSIHLSIDLAIDKFPLSIYSPSIYLSIHPSIHLSIHRSLSHTSLPLHVSFLAIYPSIYLPIFLFIYLHIYLSVYPCAYLLIYLSTYLAPIFVCLFSRNITDQGGDRYPSVTHLRPGTLPCKTLPKDTLNTT